MALPQTSLPQVETNCIAWQLLKSAYPKAQGYFRIRGFKKKEANTLHSITAPAVLQVLEVNTLLWCLTKIYYPITSPNLRPAQLSTKVTPAENVIMCLGKKGVLVVCGLLTWNVDRDYMSIPRCYDIPKKFLSNYDCNKISHGRVHQNLCVVP